jgi:hypothetical protein
MRGFAGRDHENGAVPLFCGPLVDGVQFARDKRVRIARTNAAPDDGEEVVSKVGERTGQWVCFGSDQAERPVTTSNFLRSELTSCGALSFVESCSSWLMIRASAASTSVIAPSE